MKLEVRAITNLLGNAVATVVIARWDNALDLVCARRTLANPTSPAAISAPPIGESPLTVAGVIDAAE